MERLTQEDIEAIRKRAEAATEGPWEIEDDGSGVWNRGGYNYLGGLGLCTSDAEFAVHARTDIPALLAEVERLQVELRDLESMYNEDTTELERWHAGSIEQSERNYEKFRKERRSKAQMESRLNKEVERLQTELAEVAEQTCRFANVKCRKGESE